MSGWSPIPLRYFFVNTGGQSFCSRLPFSDRSSLIGLTGISATDSPVAVLILSQPNNSQDMSQLVLKLWCSHLVSIISVVSTTQQLSYDYPPLNLRPNMSRYSVSSTPELPSLFSGENSLAGMAWYAPWAIQGIPVKITAWPWRALLSWALTVSDAGSISQPLTTRHHSHTVLQVRVKLVKMWILEKSVFHAM